jgi:HK97 family phage portal protein
MPKPDEVSGTPGGALVRLGQFLERIGSPAPGVSAVAIPKRRPEGKMNTGVQFVGVPDTGRMLYLTGEVTPDVEKLNIRTAALSSAYAFAAIDWRARKVAEAPLWVARETPDGIEWDRRHPLSKVFARPRPDMSLAELLDLTVRYRDTTARAVWVAERNSAGAVVQFAPFSGLEVRTRSGDGMIFGRYEVLANGAWTPVDRRDVIDFREILAGGQWHALTSRLEVALSKVNLGHSVDRMLRNFMLKAMFPGGVISSDPKWDPTDEDWDRFKAAIAQWYGGPANAGVPLTLKGGATFSRVGLGAADLVPAEVLDRVEATIGATFGVPPIVLGFLVGLRNSPWSQAEQMDRQAHSDTVVPLWQKISEALTQALLSPEEIDRGLSIRFDWSNVRALQEDDERRARIATLNSGIWTVNERREFTGKDPLEDADDRGDVIAGLVTFGASSFGDPNAGGDEEDLDDEEGDEDEDDLEDDEEPIEGENDEEEADDAKARRIRKRKLGARRRLRMVPKGRTKSLWADFDASTKANEPAWASAILAALQVERAATVRLARQTLKAEKSIDRDSSDAFQLAFDKLMKESRPRMRAIVEPLVLATGGQAVRTLSARIGVGFDLLQPGLMDYAAREADFLAGVMGETTSRLVVDAVQRGLKDGDTISRMIDRLSELPAFGPDRAALVARTETTRAWNGAQRSTASRFQADSGRVVMKTWLSSQDGRVREEHQALDGEQQPIDEPFSNGLQAPGEPNCRCTLTYAVSRPI